MRALDRPNFKITGEIDDPSGIDYDIMGLHKKRSITAGELSRVEYYRNYDGVTYSDLVVDETREYIRNPYLIATKRIQVSRWYLEDGTIGMEKTFTKYYSPEEGIEEGVTRRSNVIAQVKTYVISKAGLTNGFDLMNTYASELTLYINGATQPLKDGIRDCQKAYITEDIKSSIIALLSL